MEPVENLRAIRLKKLAKLKKLGVDPYPAKAEKKHSVGQCLSSLGKKVATAGRIMAIRTHGGSTFADLVDQSGKIQIFLARDKLGPKPYTLVANLDVGDFLQVEGKIDKTQAGEITIFVDNFTILAKSIRPLPSKWYGLKDVEERFRRRYLDLIFNPEIKKIFVLKTKFWENIRNYLKEAGFLEVETPVLEAVPGGADAAPFITHHAALDVDLYLRISLELHLKRLIVAGFEKIFELGRVFRNEGIDAEHLQDYTQLEFYWAYADYWDLANFSEDFYKTVISQTFGTLKFKFDDTEIDWGKPWKRIDYFEIFATVTGLDLEKVSEDNLREYAVKIGLQPPKFYGKGRLIDLIYKKKIRPKLVQPAFLVNHPVDVSPLAKKLERNPRKVQRLQVMAFGSELGNGWSELNDPVDQRERFLEQAKLRKKGDEEAQMADWDFVESLEYGMPPTAGFGLSERLFAKLVGKPMREVVFFPILKPK